MRSRMTRLSVSCLILPLAAASGASAASRGLTPADTVIVIPQGPQEDYITEAADLLQHWLRKATGSAAGFEIVAEDKIAPRTGPGPKKTILALGPTQRARAVRPKKLWRDGFVIRRDGDVIVIAGGGPRGTFFGAVHFLDRFAGVRFYMPGDLFTSLPAGRRVAVPEGVNIRREPFVKVISLSGVGSANNAPGERQWLRRNAGWTREGLAGTHQHNMWAAFGPDKYAAKYPEIYPIIDGKRYLPKDRRDQKWQPCFSEPKLLDAAEETIAEYYRKHPDHLWYSLGVQDSHTTCQCPRCAAVRKKFIAEDAKLGGVKANSHLYWTFIDKLARRLQKTLPGRNIEGLGYAQVRIPPATPLPPNVIVYTVLHVSELEADGVLTPGDDGLSIVDRWLKVIRRGYGNHDWYRGMGYVMPRIYTGYWSRYLRHLKRSGLEIYQHAEIYPNWGMDAAKAYVLTRCLWDPDTDPRGVWEQFCADMFGPAAEPMIDYFTKLEELWVWMDNRPMPREMIRRLYGVDRAGVIERKINRYSTQFATTEQHRQIIALCRGHLDHAARLVETPEQTRRLDLLSKCFRLSEYMFELAAPGETVDAALIAEAKRFAAQRIIPDRMTLHYTMRKPQVIERAIKGAIYKKRIVGGSR